MISKTKHKDQKEQQELSDEEDYQTDQQYEQERFTDEYNEYFEDDENKAERFTDEYNENLRLVNIHIYIDIYIIYEVDVTIIRNTITKYRISFIVPPVNENTTISILCIWHDCVHNCFVVKQQKESTPEDPEERYEITQNLDKTCKEFRDSGLSF